jgi:hypothetical protein
MKNDDLDQNLRDALSGVAPAEVHERTEAAFQNLAERLRQRDAAQERETRHSARERSRLWWLWPGMSLAGAAAMAILMFSVFSAPTVSWSQVVERFGITFQEEEREVKMVELQPAKL